MPRHWRCAHGHTWVGELGALTFCPECGSADVYEVRLPGQTLVGDAATGSGQTVMQSPTGPGQTFVQSPPAGTGQTLLLQPSVGSAQTFVQPSPAKPSDTLIQSHDRAAAPNESSDITLNQPGVSAVADSGDSEVDLGQKKKKKPPVVDRPPEIDADVTLVMPKSVSVADPSTETGDFTAASEGPDFGPGGTVVQEAETRSDTLEFEPIDETGEFEDESGRTADVPADGTAVVTVDPDLTGQPTRLDTEDESGRTAEVPVSGETAGLQPTRAEHGTIIQPSAGGASEKATVANAKAREKPRSASVKGMPTVVGYEVLGVLGRGGMGVVYKARQQGLNRLVALKMIIGGAHARPTDRGRFRQEAEAVAALQHPNIVQVYETGERDGLPFFSLEFLDGGSLQEKCKGQPLPPRAAAECVERLALAMQYAHDHGIVHRDLKPANILLARSAEKSTTSVGARSTRTMAAAVTIADGAYIPKITDFGLAKRLEAESGFTGTGAILGTPSYMAPEQAEGKTHAIGPLADIYALGAILYELLTGRPPFLGTDAMDTILKVRSVDPIPPSQSQPKTPRDLETVCLKCLLKEPEKRYSTAGELAADLRRFLDGQPVQARPVPAWEKAYKYAKRYPSHAIAVALATAIMIGVPVGFAIAWQRERGLKNKEQMARETAEFQRDRAQRRLGDTRAAVDSLLVRVGNFEIKNSPKMERVRYKMLADSLAIYNRLLKEESTDPGVREDAAWAHLGIGRIRDMLGQRSSAIAEYRQATELFGGLVDANKDKDPKEDGVQSQHANLADAYRLLMVALEADRQTVAAELAYESAEHEFKQLIAVAPANLEYQMQLGTLLNNRGIQLKGRGRLEDSAAAFRQAGEAFETAAESKKSTAIVEWAKAQTNRSTILMGLKRSGEAAQEARTAVNRLTKLVRDDPEAVDVAMELGRTYNNLGGILTLAGQAVAADKVYHDAIDLLSALVKDHPDTHEFRYAEALAHKNLAHLIKETQSLQAAEPEREKARELFAVLAKEQKDNTDYLFEYGLSLDEYAIYLDKFGRRAQAIDAARTALQLFQRLQADDPADPGLRHKLALRSLNLGILLAKDTNFDEADTLYGHAAELLELLRIEPDVSPSVLKDLATVHENRAYLMKDLGRSVEVFARCRQAAQVLTAFVAVRPDAPDERAELASLHAALAGMQDDKPAKAIASLRDAVREQREAVRLAPRRADLATIFGGYGAALVEALMNTGDHAAASDAATDLGRDLPTASRDWPRIAGFVARCIRLAREDMKLSAEDRVKLAKGYGDQALGILKRSVAAGYKDAAALKDSADLEPLRSGEWRAEFEKLLVQVETKNKQ
jgi:serine/threonine protein kinase